jgi:ankyrin repeat protein
MRDPSHLCLSIYYNWTDIAVSLLKYGADVNRRGTHKDAPISDFTYRKVQDPELYATPLQIAVERENLVIVRALLAAKANPDLGHHSLPKPLVGAVKKRSKQIITQLLDGGADPNIRDSKLDGTTLWGLGLSQLEGTTPLRLALRQYEDGDQWIVNLLLERSANPCVDVLVDARWQIPADVLSDKIPKALQEKLRTVAEERQRKNCDDFDAFIAASKSLSPTRPLS